MRACRLFVVIFAYCNERPLLHCLITNTVVWELELFGVRDFRFKAQDGLSVCLTHADVYTPK